MPPRRKRAEPPFLFLAETKNNQRIIAACCGASLRAGVRAGMSVAHATALLPASSCVILRDHAPLEDAAALLALARWAVRFSPVVAPDYPDGLLLDVTGCQRLYGSDEHLAALVTGALRSLGLDARVGIAPTIGAAWAVARFATEQPSLRLCDSSDCCVISEDEWPELFERLPVAALRIDEKIIDELAEVGIDYVGQLLQIPREEIASRFDADLLLRIDQASGDAMEVLRSVRYEEPPRVSIRFAGPTTQLEAIEQAVRRLVDELCARLLKREAGARKLELEVERLDEELHPEWTQETLTLSRPSRSAKHIWNLLHPRIERLHLGEGVEELLLTAKRTAPLPHEQERFDGSSDESEEQASARLKESAGQFVDLLESRLGASAVLAGEVIQTHIPEAAYRSYPASEGGLRLAKIQVPDVPSSKNAMPAPGPATRGTSAIDEHHNFASIGTTTSQATSTIIPPPGDRPTILFEKPEPAEVALLQPEGPIIGLQWHRPRRIITAIGPERIARRWWHFAFSRRRPARDYYRLQDENGLWLWVYRSRYSRRWFVHGVWG